MRQLFVLLLCCLSLGCSTVHTIRNAEDGVAMRGSYCGSIDHIFSGVQYNWCKLHGEPKKQTNQVSSKGNFEYVGIDSAFSFIADIVVLPYTIYKQVSSDPITVWSSESYRSDD